jgi:hypothetical protein
VNSSTGKVDLGAQNRHEVTVRVVVEQWKAGKTKQHTILQHTLIPAEIVGQTVFLSHVPTPMPVASVNRTRDPMAAIRDVAMSFTEWLPVLQVGRDQVFQESVDARGEPNSKPNVGTKSSQPAPPQGFAGGFDALGGGDQAASDDTRFTGEWIEYEIRSPGTRPQIVRREIFDILLPAERSGQTAPVENDDKRLARSLSLLGSVQILAQTSLLVPEFVIEKSMAETLANRDVLVALKRALNSDTAEVSLDANLRFWPISEHLYELALARFAWSPVGADVYIASPNVLTYRRTLRQNQEGKLVSHEGFDIVSNAVRLRPEARKPSFLTQVTQGTADTNVEALLLKDSTSNAGSALASQAQPQLLALRSSQELVRLGQAWPEAARTLISDALQAGYVVVVSNTQDAPKSTAPTWWRIDPRTGETLGMGSDGWGQATVENVLGSILIGMYSAFYVGIYVAVITYQLCMRITETSAGRAPNAEEARHCRCEAVDTGIIGGGVAAGGAAAFLGLAMPLMGAIIATSGAVYLLIMQILKAASCAN